MMNDLRDRTVLLLGLGASGLAMARWSHGLGARLRVWDTRDAPPQAQALAQHVPSAQWWRGDLTDAALDGVSLVLKSPGLAPGDPRIAAALAGAQARGVAVLSELELFAQALAELKARYRYAPEVLAVTGTNGKTTTTALTALLVQRTGRRVAVAGNIGPTMLQTLTDALDLERLPQAPPSEIADPTSSLAESASPAAAAAHTLAPAVNDDDHGQYGPAHDPTAPAADAVDGSCDVDAAAALPPGTEAHTESASEGSAEHPVEVPIPLALPPPSAPRFEFLPEVWVLELSSFQLHGVRGFAASAATVLNVTQDHLDWHGDLQAYAADKARIYAGSGVMVVNRDDALVQAMVPVPEVPKRVAGRKVAAAAPRTVVSFGLGAPQRPGDFGILDEGGMAWLVRARELDETLSRGRGGKGLGQAALEELSIQRLMPADALHIRGRHNAANALAALALATAIGCPLAPMLPALRAYRGEPHRVETLGLVAGIECIDDSKGTNVGATVAAVAGSLRPLVLIAGGEGKGQDFTPLAAALRGRVHTTILIGKDAPALARVLDGVCAIQHAATMPEAVERAARAALPGDAVLLSPACASLDMFRDYAHRGAEFAAAVRALPEHSA